ncbi:MAG: OmpA family protein, partial [Paludibacteraceae bacterium]|nr:OmpA family protein [Paludibacteraceae bacterium]
VNDKIDGRGYSYNPVGVASKNNDGIVDVTMNLRFKLESVKKTHVRNISHDIAWDQNLRKAKKDTVVMIIRDTVVMKPETISVAAAPSTSTSKSEYHSRTSSTITGQTFYVYFDNARSELTEQGLTIVQQVADRMLNDSNLYVDVVGMCDNTGSDEINNRLAAARAASVLEELRGEYGIANNHCLTSGRGKIVGRKSKAAYGPNRRVEIRLISKQEYDRLKAEREQRGDVTDASKEKPAAPTTTTQTTVEESSSNTTTTSVTITEEDNEQAARQTVLNDPTGRTVRQKESVNAVTLTSLARKHYGNANCWVFIYEANKEKIVDINTMPVGVDITIPQLTDEQKRISKEDALVYYYRIK